MKRHYFWSQDRIIIIGLTISLCLLYMPTSVGQTYSLSQGDVVGQNYKMKVQTGVTMYNLVRRTGVGLEELAAANPKHSPELHNRRYPVIVPHQFVLPNTAKKGIVINIAELRLYYYPNGSNTVITYPVGIGRKGWKTPLTTTKVVSKTANPKWRVPKSIQLDMAARQGIILPDVIPGGDKNPLGTHALYLGLPGYLIHGTNMPYGVGQRISSGCIRLLPENIISLYQKVAVGTPVRIVNQPYKVGWANNQLYLEAHPILDDYKAKQADYKADMKKTITHYAKQHGINVNWNKVQSIAQEKTGLPQVITTR